MAQLGTGLLMQALQTLDAVHLAGQLAQQGGLVTAAGADLQHPAEFEAGSIEQQGQHAGNHAGLGDGLAQANRQAGVFIGLVDQGRINKAVPLHLAHGREHHGVADALCLQFAHHAQAHGHGIKTDAGGNCVFGHCPKAGLGSARR